MTHQSLINLEQILTDYQQNRTVPDIEHFSAQMIELAELVSLQEFANDISEFVRKNEKAILFILKNYPHITYLATICTMVNLLLYYVSQEFVSNINVLPVMEIEQRLTQVMHRIGVDIYDYNSVVSNVVLKNDIEYFMTVMGVHSWLTLRRTIRAMSQTLMM